MQTTIVGLQACRLTRVSIGFQACEVTTPRKEREKCFGGVVNRYVHNQPKLAKLSNSPTRDTMAEWSKAVVLSFLSWITTTEMCVGSNPTRVNELFLLFDSFFARARDLSTSSFQSFPVFTLFLAF